MFALWDRSSGLTCTATLGTAIAPVSAEMAITRQSLTRFWVVVALAATVSGCSVSVGDKYMKQSEVEAKAAEALAQSKNLPVSSVPPITCPGDLKGKVGTTMTCSIGTPPKVYDVNLNVTRFDEKTDQVYFDVKVANTPRP